MTTEPTPHDPIPAEPETEAGRILLDYIQEHLRGVHDRTDPELPAQFAAIEREARASLADANAELREALSGYVRETRERWDEEGVWSGVQPDGAELLASPSPSADYAARLRREGAEAALDVERIAKALRYVELHPVVVEGPPGEDEMDEHEWLARAVRAAILAQTEGESDAD